MPEINAMVTVSVHYWAGARAAAGVSEEKIDARSVAEALAVARRQRSDPRFDRVLRVSSVLIDGRTAHQEDLERQLTQAVQVEVLPPFAGGS
jgi:molybdopterin converting factor small subunit